MIQVMVTWKRARTLTRRQMGVESAQPAEVPPLNQTQDLVMARSLDKNHSDVPRGRARRSALLRRLIDHSQSERRRRAAEYP